MCEAHTARSAIETGNLFLGFEQRFFSRLPFNPDSKASDHAKYADTIDSDIFGSCLGINTTATYASEHHEEMIAEANSVAESVRTLPTRN